MASRLSKSREFVSGVCRVVWGVVGKLYCVQPLLKIQLNYFGIFIFDHL
jgi:hypothetical protein